MRIKAEYQSSYETLRSLNESNCKKKKKKKSRLKPQCCQIPQNELLAILKNKARLVEFFRLVNVTIFIPKNFNRCIFIKNSKCE